jgi:hypothetical protein
MPNIEWINAGSLNSKSFLCGYCGESIASDKGFHGHSGRGVEYFIYICHSCKQPTYLDVPGKMQTPGAPFGNAVKHIPSEEIQSLYNEARNSVSVNAFTGSVLCCRKLLMNIAVSKGAREGMKFIEYVDYLADKNFIPPDGREWVDHVRQKGNEATHEIAIMKRDDAEDLITFVEALLKFIYEYPGMIAARKRGPVV